MLVKFIARCKGKLTPVGKFIRKNLMDELPQLINVLLGIMEPDWSPSIID